MLFDPLRARIARRLERGSAETGWLRAASALWSTLAAPRVCRPFVANPRVFTIGIGGALLGGSGKTPVAIAVARGMAKRGARVAVIGHGYRAHPERPHRVDPCEPLATAGDDALCAARLLAPDGIAVIAGPTRQAAADYAAAEGFTTLILDGLLQAAPCRLDAAVLVLDAALPWGSGACPPLGDLRAPREALLAAADHVAVIAGQGEAPGDLDQVVPGAIRVGSSLNGAVDASGRRIALSELAQGRAGVLLAIARPERVTRMLARYGVYPAVTIALADHAILDARTRARAKAAGVEYWLTTARCATKLPAQISGRPVLWLDHAMDASRLVERIPISNPSLARPVSAAQARLPLFASGDPTLAERIDEALKGFGER